MTQSQGVITPNTSRTPGTTPVLKILLAVVGAITGLTAIGLLIAGTALVGIHTTQRDDGGFITSPVFEMETATYALVSGDIDLGSYPDGWWPSDSGTVRVNAESIDAGAIFIGIGPASDVEQYISGVAVDEVTSLGPRGRDVEYRPISGGAPTSLPADQEFWVAASQGTGFQEFEWELESGEWKLVLMNANSSSGLQADVEAGVQINILLPIGIGLLVGGLVAIVVTVVFLVLALRTGRPKNGLPETAYRTDQGTYQR